MNARYPLFSILLCVGSVFATGTTAAATTLQAYAFSISTQSGVGTDGPTEIFRDNYPGGFSSKIYPSTDGKSAASEQFQPGTSGSVTATSSATGTGNSSNGSWDYTSNSSSSASYGRLGVSASTSANGGGDANTLRGSQAFAVARDTLTITWG